MKKFLSAVIIILQISFSLLPMQSLALDETTTVIVHYQETEDNEKDWNLWVWPVGGEGEVCHFTEDDVFGKVVTVVLPGNHDSVGFIVRTDSWEKDTSNDRFVEEFNNGVAEILLVKYCATAISLFENAVGEYTITGLCTMVPSS